MSATKSLRSLAADALFKTIRAANEKQALHDKAYEETSGPESRSRKAYDILRNSAIKEDGAEVIVRAIGIIVGDSQASYFTRNYAKLETFSCLTIPEATTGTIIVNGECRTFLNKEGGVSSLGGQYKTKAATVSEISKTIAELTDAQWSFIFGNPVFAPIFKEPLDEEVPSEREQSEPTPYDREFSSITQ